MSLESIAYRNYFQSRSISLLTLHIRSTFGREWFRRNLGLGCHNFRSTSSKNGIHREVVLSNGDGFNDGYVSGGHSEDGHADKSKEKGDEYEYLGCKDFTIR